MKNHPFLARLPFPITDTGEARTRYCVEGVMSDDPELAADKFTVASANGPVPPTYCVDCLGDLAVADLVYGQGAMKCMQCGSVFKLVGS